MFNTSPERATFPVLGSAAQPDVRSGKEPVTVGTSDPERREQEGVGLVSGATSPSSPSSISSGPHPELAATNCDSTASRSGSARTDPIPDGGQKRWFIPNYDDVSTGRKIEPITVYTETPPRQLRFVGSFDITPEASVQELDAWLLAGETIRPDASRLFRSRPGEARFQNPFAEQDGQPGVVYRWLEVEGPIHDQWPPAGHQLLFGDLPIEKPKQAQGRVEVVSLEPEQNARRLLASFTRRAYRRPVDDAEALRFLPLITSRLKAGASFAEAMITGYTAVLCSPEFVYIDEKPGLLDDHALAARAGAFPRGTPSPTRICGRSRTVASCARPEVLRAQTNRLLDDPKSQRLRERLPGLLARPSQGRREYSDSSLYNDYYLDDLLAESAVSETQLFFAELLRGDLPASNLISSDFVMINERLADHYGLQACGVSRSARWNYRRTASRADS